MRSRKKVLNLLLDDGTLEGLMIVEDSTWNLGILLSCPRNSIEKLLGLEELQRYGIYFLLSKDKVYVGQSSELKSRIEQHLLGKDWWERAIILTTKDDSLDKSDIDYLESVFIEISSKIGTLDSENKNKGNKRKIDKFRQATLDEYIDEALFILRLIGIDALDENLDKKKTEHTTIKTIPLITEEEKIARTKSEVIKFVENNGYHFNGYVSYASLQISKGIFWNNASTAKCSEEWDLVLNDQVNRLIYIMHFPRNSLKASLTKKEGCLIIRKDRPQYLDINIENKSFIEIRSKVDLSGYIVNRIKY